ncbi:MAG: PRC-barrel domain containing protein [Actinobacteria bacterium]|nr:MAG: PRC-barrel domain containing protein [Actinomycetota bacterium]
MALQKLSEMSGEWRVEPEENDIREFDVIDRDGEDIGEVEDLLLDSESRTIGYALVGRGWLAEMFGREPIIVPLRKMDIDRQDASAHLDISREELDEFPEYESISEPDLKQRVDEFWGMETYRRPMEGEARYGRQPAEQRGQIESPRREELVQVSSRPIVVEEVRLYRIPSEQGPLTTEEREEIEREREKRRREEEERGAA